MIKPAITTELNASTFVAITLGSQEAYGFGVYALDTTTGGLVSFYYANNAAGTGAVLAPPIGIVWGHYEPALNTVLYAKSLTGTPSLVLIPLRLDRY